LSLARRFAGSLRSGGSLRRARLRPRSKDLASFELPLYRRCRLLAASPARSAPVAHCAALVRVLVRRTLLPSNCLYAVAVARSPLRRLAPLRWLTAPRSFASSFEGPCFLRPASTPSLSLARRFAGSLRSGGSLRRARSRPRSKDLASFELPPYRRCRSLAASPARSAPVAHCAALVRVLVRRTLLPSNCLHTVAV